MGVSDMFGEFISIISYLFKAVFINKYLVLFLGVAAGLGVSVISYLIRWFNHA